MSALFSKEEGERGGDHRSDKSATVIGPTVKIDGTFASEDNIVVDGQVVGMLTTTQDLTVGEGARIEADVTAANMYIAGEMRGNLKASGTITLTSTARVYGDVETSIISVETGAVLQGRCVTGAKMSAPAAVASEEEPSVESKKK